MNKNVNIINYNNKKNAKVEDNKKNIAEYIYVKKEKNGEKKEFKFVSKYISTIDIPYSKYLLK